jgi:hypothetical protein
MDIHTHTHPYKHIHILYFYEHLQNNKIRSVDLEIKEVTICIVVNEHLAYYRNVAKS